MLGVMGTGTEEESGARTGGIWEDGRKMVERRMRIIKSTVNVIDLVG